MRKRVFMYVIAVIVIGTSAAIFNLYAQVSEQQADQLRTSLLAANKVKTEAQGIKRNVGDPRVQEFITQQVADLQKRLKEMKTSHDNFMQGLSADQKERIQSNITRLNSLYESMNSTAAKLAQQVKKSPIDRSVVGGQAETIIKSASEWQAEYRSIASIMRVKLERS